MAGAFGSVVRVATGAAVCCTGLGGLLAADATSCATHHRRKRKKTAQPALIERRGPGLPLGCSFLLLRGAFCGDSCSGLVMLPGPTTAVFCSLPGVAAAMRTGRTHGFGRHDAPRRGVRPASRSATCRSQFADSLAVSTSGKKAAVLARNVASPPALIRRFSRAGVATDRGSLQSVETTHSGLRACYARSKDGHRHVP